jgi:hypothetical protein
MVHPTRHGASKPTSQANAVQDFQDSKYLSAFRKLEKQVENAFVVLDQESG